MNRLNKAHVVLAHEGKRRLVVEVLALAADVLVFARQQGDGLAAAPTALLAAGDAPLRLLELLLRLMEVAGVLHDLPIRRDEEHFQTNIDARLLACRRKRLGGHLGT
ncbi:MAG TPA: hypothetical protein VGS80_01060, partial [Ktedonobacterales bacterium]|nr:hypothetical protein [Ktedonobacterales bacterium]